MKSYYVVIKWIFVLIVSLLIIPINFYLMDIPVFLAFIVAAIIILFMILTHFKEKRNDKKASEIKREIIDESYFNSAEWREIYLNRINQDFFEIPDTRGIISDLKKRYRRMVSIPFMLFGLFMMCGSVCIAIVDTSNILYSFFALSIGISLFYYNGVKFLIASPLKKFYKNNPDFEDIENSYLSGVILSNRIDSQHFQGINIGAKYTVIFNNDAVYLINNSQISNISREVVRVKEYQDTIYVGENYKFKLNITANMAYSVELDAYQVEAALSELRALAGDADKTAYMEKTENEIVV